MILLPSVSKQNLTVSYVSFARNLSYCGSILSNDLKIIQTTEPSYQNENSDSISRKPLDQIRNTFDIKQIFLFYKVFVIIISLNSIICSTILTILSISIYSSILSACCNKMRTRAKQQAGVKGRMGGIFSVLKQSCHA